LKTIEIMDITPKEKADNLIRMCYGHTITLENAKNLALICATEVIKEIPMYKGELNPRYKFWSEVIREIENFEI